MTLAALLLAAALAPHESASVGAGEATAQEASNEQSPAVATGGAQAFIEAGLQAFKKQRFAAALVEFQKAVDADPQSAAAAFYLGYTYYKLAEPGRRADPRKRRAAELFAKAFELDPTFTPAWGPTALLAEPADYLSRATRSTGLLSDETVARHASAHLGAERAQLILDNDVAFRSKLDLVTGARTTIDAMYYIWQDDYSSSALAEALIAAATRGVRVRLLLDYHTNYKRLDLFSMMERRSRGAGGSLEVRLYNRPTRNVVRDAVYLTLGCGTAAQRGADPSCAPARLAESFAEIERRFEAELIDGRPARELGLSNLNLARSGLFLSGWYAKRPDVMALAVAQPPASVLEGTRIPPVAANPEALARAEARIRLTTASSGTC
jgi:hypothetical protein